VSDIGVPKLPAIATTSNSVVNLYVMVPKTCTRCRGSRVTEDHFVFDGVCSKRLIVGTLGCLVRWWKRRRST